MRWMLVLVVVVGCARPEYEFDDARTPCPALGAVCDDVAGAGPRVGDPIVMAPSDRLPAEVVSQAAHNNLDVIWFRGRLYFAFRTAPYHFASPKVVMYVVSTADGLDWTFETALDMDTDLREPRFLAVGDRLMLYYAVLGDFLATFEPREARVIELVAPGEWSEPTVVTSEAGALAGFIPWRAKTIDGVPSITGYVGGESIYEPGGEPVRVSWSTIGADPSVLRARHGDEVVLTGGSSETDLVQLDDGTVIAVSRNELGDELGWGSKICRAEASAPDRWTCVADRKKYDSPLLFRHGDRVFLIGRRQLANDGAYDLLKRELSAEEQTRAYELAYWNTPKRCALWEVDPSSLAVSHVLDLPSAGDTCFASLIELGDGRYWVFDYTSSLADPDIAWMDAQLRDTQIHAMTLAL